MDEKLNTTYKNIVSFQRKPAKMGERFVFNIPKIYIDNNLIEPNQEYKIYCLRVNLKDGRTSLDDFIRFAKICPICQKENEKEYLEEFFFSEDPEKVELRNEIIRLSENKIIKDSIVKIGIPCFDCYTKIYNSKEYKKNKTEYKKI